MDSKEISIDKLVARLEDPKTTKRDFFEAIARIKTILKMQ